ncbi:MAG: hypothetical protein M3R02_22955 [Chloroflexota bacterium]|nr:hypothetical protein [Chloroflexota bacterium]
MSKQRLDPDKIANELRGASGFFKQPATPEVPETRATPPETAPPPPAAVPAPPAAPIRPLKRQMIRHPFELYADQLDRLRELAQAQRQRGETGSMSKMIRDAIDHLLDEQSAAD